jgi:hypothetical protein
VDGYVARTPARHEVDDAFGERHVERRATDQEADQTFPERKVGAQGEVIATTAFDRREAHAPVAQREAHAGPLEGVLRVGRAKYLKSGR